MKAFLYFVAAIFLSVCVYALVEGVTVITVQNPQQHDSTEAEGPLKTAIDNNSTVLCEVESLWAEYNVWGDTDTMYKRPDNDEAADKKMNGSMSCDEPSEQNK